MLQKMLVLKLISCICLQLWYCKSANYTKTSRFTSCKNSCYIQRKGLSCLNFELWCGNYCWMWFVQSANNQLFVVLIFPRFFLFKIVILKIPFTFSYIQINFKAFKTGYLFEIGTDAIIVSKLPSCPEGFVAWDAHLSFSAAVGATPITWEVSEQRGRGSGYPTNLALFRKCQQTWPGLHLSLLAGREPPQLPTPGSPGTVGSAVFCWCKVAICHQSVIAALCDLLRVHQFGQCGEDFQGGEAVLLQNHLVIRLFNLRQYLCTVEEREEIQTLSMLVKCLTAILDLPGK